MPPLVEGGDGHSEIVGEFFDGEQPVEGFHGRILQPDPFSRMSFGLSVTLQLHSYTGVFLPGRSVADRSGDIGYNVPERCVTPLR